MAERAKRRPAFPGAERQNVYCPIGCKHPWAWRPPRTDEAHWFDAGWRAVRFVESLCRHTKGRWKGRPFRLYPFQLALMLRLFGTVDDEGLRVTRTCYVEWARKNGKSELAAAVALQGLFADGEESAEVYGAAWDQDQAAIVFNVAADMVELEPKLAKRATVIRSRKRIIVPKTGSIYWAIPAEAAGAHGFNASRVIFDEVHTQKTRELYDVLGTSGGTRDQPLTFAITTAGYDRTSLCWQLHEYSEKVDKGVISDPSRLSDIRNTPADADWTDRRVWAIANPGLGTRKDIAEGRAFRSVDELAAKVAEATEVPPMQNTVRRLYLNQWTAQRTRAIPLDLWDKGAGIVDEVALEGRTCYGGLDLASSVDLAAWVLVFVDDDDEDLVEVVCRFFVPAENVADRERRDGVAYGAWIAQGFVTATEGDVIDYGAITAAIDADATRYDVASVGYDRWGATQLSQDLAEAGLEVVPIAQTFGGLGPPTREFLRRVKAQKIRHGGNPVLRWMVDNVEMDQDPNGNLKPNKKRSTGRIDGVPALIMALDRATRREQLAPSAYEDRGLETV